MASELVLATLLRTSLAVTAVLLLVIASRLLIRRLFGPSLAYSLWAIVPAAAGVSLLPAYAEFQTAWSPQSPAPFGLGKALAALEASPALLGQAPTLVALWSVGAAALAALILVAETRFRRLAKLGLVGPAIIGVAAPRIVVPHNFKTMFTMEERLLIRRHERAHIDGGHPAANALVAVMQLVFWFNPLIHLAAALMRADQELACDAAVLEFRPSERRAYAQTLLKAHAAPSAGPLGCSLAARDVKALETRIRWLMKGEMATGRHVRGAAIVGLLGLCAALTLWASGPDDVMRNPGSVSGGSVLGRSGARVLLLRLRTG